MNANLLRLFANFTAYFFFNFFFLWFMLFDYSGDPLTVRRVVCNNCEIFVAVAL